MTFVTLGDQYGFVPVITQSLITASIMYAVWLIKIEALDFRRDQGVPACGWWGGRGLGDAVNCVE